MTRYQITQESDGTWVIVSTRDPGVAWTGYCWVARDLGGALSTSFADEAAAQRYAKRIFESDSGCTNDR